MVVGRVMHENIALFPDFDSFEYGKDDGFWEMELFLQIPNLTKTNILEYFEYRVFGNTVPKGRVECDSLFVPMHYLYLNNEIADNDPNPTYISEYINIVGQLFLAGYIEFGMCGLQDKQENLLSNQGSDKYQAWIHFRDNFFYTDAYYRDYEILDDSESFSTEAYGKAGWDMPKYWDRYTFWVARTEKGTQYFNEILAPRFYNKYKDLRVEIDSKGNVIRWIGKINEKT